MATLQSMYARSQPLMLKKASNLSCLVKQDDRHKPTIAATVMSTNGARQWTVKLTTSPRFFGHTKDARVVKSLHFVSSFICEKRIPRKFLDVVVDDAVDDVVGW
jgi:hypothetical protein